MNKAYLSTEFVSDFLCTVRKTSLFETNYHQPKISRGPNIIGYCFAVVSMLVHAAMKALYTDFIRRSTKGVGVVLC